MPSFAWRTYVNKLDPYVSLTIELFRIFLSSLVQLLVIAAENLHRFGLRDKRKARRTHRIRIHGVHRVHIAARHALSLTGARGVSPKGNGQDSEQICGKDKPSDPSNRPRGISVLLMTV